MKHCVYIITNLINDKKYIGDHTIVKNNYDKYYLGSGSIIKTAVKKYGRKNFKKEVLEYFDSKQEAFNAQEKYIQQYNTLVPRGYNISPTGGLQYAGRHSKKTKQIIGLKNSIKLKGKKQSQDHIKNRNAYLLDGRTIEIEIKHCLFCNKLFISYKGKRCCNIVCSNRYKYVKKMKL